MIIETIRPQAALSEYIDFYYFIKADALDFSSVHYSFPHTVNAVSIYDKAHCLRSSDAIAIHGAGDGDRLTILQGKRQTPIRVQLSGAIDRISIFFKPLGLNQFMLGSMATAMKYATNDFNAWNEQGSYAQCLEQCFATADQQERIKLLEEFLLCSFRPQKYPKIEFALTLLVDFERDPNIEAIAKEINTPLRTFNRQFRDVIGVSPIEYKRIARFRHSMNDKLFGVQFKRLTDIGYNSNFYDQSYFVKMYKKLTGLNPGAFFNAVEKLGDDQLIFRFVKS